MADEISVNFTLDVAETAAAYFTVDELRAFDDALASKPDAELDDMRLTVEEAVEQAANVAFVPRLRTETFSGAGTERLIVTAPRVRRAVSATADGEVLDVSQVRAVTKRGLWRPDGWPEGRANLVVTYEHGYDAPPRRAKRAAMILAKTWLLRGPIDERATQVVDAAGGALNLSTPGMFGAVFGIPEVDAVFCQPKRRGGYFEPPLAIAA